MRSENITNKHPSGAKQVAEKGLNLGKIPEKHPAGAKARPLLSGICGPTEVVPLLQNPAKSSFSAACKAPVPSAGFLRGLKPPPPSESSHPTEFQAARIRRMTPAELDRVIEIAASLPEAPQWPRSAYLAALSPDAAPPRIALVAQEPETGAVTGFAVASLIPPQAELEIIAVAPAWQRRGLGRRLFAALAEQLYAAQVNEVILEARASNLAALGLYRSLGFVETGRRPRYYHDPIEDALLMRLWL
jgi:ribosomal-protein-alanine N-acetyltransferase